jgi:hypothetical protein
MKKGNKKKTADSTLSTGIIASLVIAAVILFVFIITQDEETVTGQAMNSVLSQFRPNLEVSDISAIRTEDQVGGLEHYDIYITIRNSGKVSAKEVIAIAESAPTNTYTGGYESAAVIGLIRSRSSQVVLLPGKYRKEADLFEALELYATIDPSDRISESNEHDNTHVQVLRLV